MSDAVRELLRKEREAYMRALQLLKIANEVTKGGESKADAPQCQSDSSARDCPSDTTTVSEIVHQIDIAVSNEETATPVSHLTKDAEFTGCFMSSAHAKLSSISSHSSLEARMEGYAGHQVDTSPSVGGGTSYRSSLGPSHSSASDNSSLSPKSICDSPVLHTEPLSSPCYAEAQKKVDETDASSETNDSSLISVDLTFDTVATSSAGQPNDFMPISLSPRPIIDTDEGERLPVDLTTEVEQCSTALVFATQLPEDSTENDILDPMQSMDERNREMNAGDLPSSTGVTDDVRAMWDENPYPDQQHGCPDLPLSNFCNAGGFQSQDSDDASCIADDAKDITEHQLGPEDEDLNYCNLRCDVNFHDEEDDEANSILSELAPAPVLPSCHPSQHNAVLCQIISHLKTEACVSPCDQSDSPQSSVDALAMAQKRRLEAEAAASNFKEAFLRLQSFTCSSAGPIHHPGGCLITLLKNRSTAHLMNDHLASSGPMPPQDRSKGTPPVEQLCDLLSVPSPPSSSSSTPSTSSTSSPSSSCFSSPSDLQTQHCKVVQLSAMPMAVDVSMALAIQQSLADRHLGTTVVLV